MSTFMECYDAQLLKQKNAKLANQVRQTVEEDEDAHIRIRGSEIDALGGNSACQRQCTV